MARPGPPPDPNSRRSRAGKNTFRPQLVGPEYVSPQPERTIDDIPERRPPSWLGADGREYWRRHQRRLELAGSLTDRTIEEFATVCASWEMYRHAVRALATQGVVIVPERGRSYRSPWTDIRKDALRELRRGFDRFGMRPPKSATVYAPPAHAAAAATQDDEDDLD